MEPINNFTPRAQKIITFARKEAIRFHSHCVGTEHILLAIISIRQSFAINILQKLKVDFNILIKILEKQIKINDDQKSLPFVEFSQCSKKVIVFAIQESHELKHPYVGTEHLLLGLLREEESVAFSILKSFDLNIDLCRNIIIEELDPNYTNHQDFEISDLNEEKNELKTSALNVFGKDLTEMAKNKVIDPVIGREKEIQRVIQILCRRTKNNPVLIGEAGVGKTAIIEGLAQKIAFGLVPNVLLNYKIFALDLALIVAGTKFRGQFEERIKAIMDEIYKIKNVIIFIDELHTIVGAGAAEGSMDASNILKPGLSRGEIQCIGATTLAEYKKFIEKDTALDRRFQSVKVEVPSINDTIQILNGIKEKYELYHNVKFTDAAIQVAVEASERYISNKFLPDKAIDVLDEAGASMHIKTSKKPLEIEKINNQIKKINELKNKFIDQENFEHAAAERNKEKELHDKKENILKKWKAKFIEKQAIVDQDEIYNIISIFTGIPLNKINFSNSKQFLELEKELQKKIIGQNEATKIVSGAIRRSRADIRNPKRPIGSFMFLGPTGVGKTHLAKVLANEIFGSQESIIQLDMSEYMEKFAVSRLIGSPPGYIGHDEGGQLTEIIKRKPYSIILFDEVEKAHPDFMNLLLQILEDGRLTDSLGKTVDFRNTILIMTSNVGAEQLQKNVSLGFNNKTSLIQNQIEMKKRVLDELKKFFKPELINRISDIVVFNQLNIKDIHIIVDLELEKIYERLIKKNIILEVSNNVKKFIAEKGYDQKLGARPIRRAIERYIEDPLAEKILANNFSKKIVFKVKVEKNKLSFKEKI